MRRYTIEKKLRKKLSKLFKRDKILYSAVFKKMDEIICCTDINTYKNLRKPMQRFKRVNIGPFVLTFIYDRKNDKISFFDLDHHDEAYQ